MIDDPKVARSFRYELWAHDLGVEHERVGISAEIGHNEKARAEP
jgi:hypothetical protein